MYYGQTDFRFENSTDYPIKIVTSSYDQGVSGNWNVKIYGTNVDGIRAEPKSTVYETVSPPPSIRRMNPSPRGPRRWTASRIPTPKVGPDLSLYL